MRKSIPLKGNRNKRCFSENERCDFSKTRGSLSPKTWRPHFKKTETRSGIPKEKGVGHNITKENDFRLFTKHEVRIFLNRRTNSKQTKSGFQKRKKTIFRKQEVRFLNYTRFALTWHPHSKRIKTRSGTFKEKGVGQNITKENDFRLFTKKLVWIFKDKMSDLHLSPIMRKRRTIYRKERRHIVQNKKNSNFQKTRGPNFQKHEVLLLETHDIRASENKSWGPEISNKTVGPHIRKKDVRIFTQNSRTEFSKKMFYFSFK